jgi:hypothetical protein
LVKAPRAQSVMRVFAGLYFRLAFIFGECGTVMVNALRGKRMNLTLSRIP